MAQVVVSAVLFLAVVEVAIAGTVVFSCRYILGNIFSNEKSVIDYVKDMTPLLCLSLIMDGLQTAFSGDLSSYWEIALHLFI